MSAIEAVKTVTIGENVFYVRRLDPFAGLKIFGDLQRDILPAAGQALQAVFSDGGRGATEAREQLADLAAEQGMANALRELSSRLDGNALTAWANRLLDADHVSVTINGQDMKLTADVKLLAFRDPGDILELMAEVIKFNFADFLSRWADRFGPALSRLAPPSANSAQN